MFEEEQFGLLLVQALLPCVCGGLEGLPRVPTGFVDLPPEQVVPSEESFLKFKTEVGGPRSGSVAEFINQLRLRHVLANGLARTKQDQGGVEQASIGK